MPAKVIHGHSIEIELGPSCPNPGIRRELEAQGKPYMCTSDIATWIGVDNKWYYVYRPGVSTSIIPLLELTKDEDEMFDYLKDISEFGPRLQTMCLEIVLFQPLRLIRAHYNLRLTNS
mgnify:CR=1 FL=1